MDEIRMIRNLLEEAPPTGEVVAEGRRRLTDRAPVRSTRTRRRLWGGLAVVAAATAVAVAIGLTGGGTPATGGHTPVRPMTARQILLTAAEKAAATPVGRYWHVHFIRSEGYHIDHGDYMIFGTRTEQDNWTARSDKEPDLIRVRTAGATPQTAVDRAAWARAGSPASWTVLVDEGGVKQSARSQAWRLIRYTPAAKREQKQAETRVAACAKRGACPPMPPTDKDRDAMARDPQALERYLLAAAGNGEASSLPTVAGHFLTAPSSPQLRSAVFRVLAGVPGVRSLGTARDSSGRPAIVLAGRMTQAGNVFDNELLLDPMTYAPLETRLVLVKDNGGKRVPPTPGRPPVSHVDTKGMKPGAIVRSEIYLTMGWTNTAYGD
ncbi:CU044_5270 family protein [Actinoallomurus sp. CA-142502]|uniref:CU044_5270 family protein n=1 Tax=Actinoallomurus sp. CA-142502 TaxID=3239885 RepID=UPI003D8AE7CF